MMSFTCPDTPLIFARAKFTPGNITFNNVLVQNSDFIYYCVMFNVFVLCPQLGS